MKWYKMEVELCPQSTAWPPILYCIFQIGNLHKLGLEYQNLLLWWHFSSSEPMLHFYDTLIALRVHQHQMQKVTDICIYSMYLSTNFGIFPLWMHTYSKHCCKWYWRWIWNIYSKFNKLRWLIKLINKFHDSQQWTDAYIKYCVYI